MYTYTERLILIGNSLSTCRHTLESLSSSPFSPNSAFAALDAVLPHTLEVAVGDESSGPFLGAFNDLSLHTFRLPGDKTSSAKEDCSDPHAFGVQPPEHFITTSVSGQDPEIVPACRTNRETTWEVVDLCGFANPTADNSIKGIAVHLCNLDLV